MSLVEHDDVMKALASEGADHPLRVRILPWRSWCCYDFFDAHVLDPPAEVITVDRIPITDQKSRRLVFGKRLDDLLSCPLGRRMRSDVEMDDVTSVVAHYDEGEQYAERGCGNRKESIATMSVR